MGLHHHDHGHSGHGQAHGDRPTPRRALQIAVALNSAFLVLEAVVGWWTGSLALISDAGHMISDVGALVIALVALQISEARPSPAFTFGLRRAPVLGALLNGISLVIIVALIGVEAVERLEAPPPLDGWPVIWTGVAGLGVNLGSAWYLARSQDDSVNIRGAMLHLLSDALGSVAAIVSGVAALAFGFRLADPIASLVIAVLILVGTWPLIRETLGILLQRAPGHLDVEAIRQTFVEWPEVEALLDFHLWALDSGQPVLSAQLQVSLEEVEAANRLANDLRVELSKRFGIRHATLECLRREASEMDPL